MNGFFLLLSHLKANAVVFKPPNSKMFGYRQIAINGKYLWALPTPTTFEKVDQTFIIFVIHRNFLTKQCIKPSKS